MRILLIVSSFNGLSQRVHRELSLQGHEVSVELSINDQTMIEAVTIFNPDLVVCPFLKERIPDCIWEKYTCLIVHPGIEGDRGPSSIDWAIANQESEWGVTLLQASACMDGGDIWGTSEFTMRKTTKASIYRNEVATAAARLVVKAIESASDSKFSPRRLDYDNPSVRGEDRPLMLQTDRKINWQRESSAEIIRKINAADSAPGVLDEFFGQQVYLYGASSEEELKGQPGQVIGHSDEALCRATIDGAVWIRMAKRKSGPEGMRIKLPALQVWQFIADEQQQNGVLPLIKKGHSDIRVHEHNGAAYIYFDFYNGAMGTQQCHELRKAIKAAKKRSIKVLVLMGGDNFWSNGINLNRIEAAQDSAQEAWENIQAIDDLVLEIINSPKHLTVAALRNNAGAGGAIIPLACDRVILRDGVVLNPHYKTMGLFGSEYWTYLLPKRVGATQASIMMRQCLPLLAKEAVLIGMVDELFDHDWHTYHVNLQEYIDELIMSATIPGLLKVKNARRKADEKSKRLKDYRQEELAEMYQAFFNLGSEFHYRRHQFVHKVKPEATPLHIAAHRMQSDMSDANELLLPVSEVRHWKLMGS